MIADSKELQIILKFRDEAKAGLLKSGKDFDDYANKHQSLVSKCMAHWQLFAAAGAVAFGVVAGAAAVGIKEYAEHEKAMAQVETGIKSTGSAAGVTAKELEKYADIVQRKVAIDDEDILNMQSILLTFPLIKNQVGATNDVFNQASTAALDLSTRLGKDLPSAAIMIGKALSDPIAGVTALRRVGVMLNDQQKENIKTMVEQGNLLGAQKIILAELTTEVGGSAEAYGKTLPGSLDKVKFAFADMAETLVSNNLPAFKKVANEISNFFWKMADTGTLAGLFGKGMEVALHAVQALVNIMEGKNATFNNIANALKWIATEAINLAPTILKLVAAFEAFKIINVVRSAIATLGVSLAGMSGSLGNAGAALAFFSNPIGLAIGGAALLAGGIWYLSNAHKQQEKAAREATIALGKHKDEMRDSALAAQPLVAEWKSLQDTIQGSTATDEEKAAAQERLKEVTGQIADALPGAIQGWDSEGNAILANTDKMNELINAKLKYSGIKIEAKGEAGQYEGLADTFAQDQKEGDELRGIIGDIGGEIENLVAPDVKGNLQQIFSDTEINEVTEAYSRNAKAGDEVWRMLQKNKEHATDLELTWRGSDPILKDITTSTGHLADKMKEYQTTVVDTDNKLIDTKAQMKAVGQAMVGAATEAGKTGKAMGPELSQSMGSALISTLPGLKTLGTEAAAKYAEGMLASQGRAGPIYTKLSQDIANLIASGANYDGTGGEIGKQLYDGIKTQLRQGMVDMAGDKGMWKSQLGPALAASIGTSLESADPVEKQAGANAAAKYAEGLLAGQGKTGPQFTAMAQSLANLIASGADYDGTGGEIGRKIYDSIKAELTGAGIVITPPTVPAPNLNLWTQGIKDAAPLLSQFLYPTTSPPPITQKVTVEDSEAKQRIADLNQMKLDEKTARLLADGSQAQMRVRQIDELTIADKHFNIIGDAGTVHSPFVKRSPTEIGKWLAEGIAAGYDANAAPLPVGVTGGGPPVGGLAQAWDTAAAGLKSYIDEMNLAEAPFADADAAVQKLASTDMAWATQTAQLNAARDTQMDQLELEALRQEDAGNKDAAAAIRDNKSAVERLKNESELQLSLNQTTVLNQKLIDDWNTLKGVYANAAAALDTATAAVDAYNAAEATLNKLKEVRIKGEMKLEKQAFAQEQAINKAHLEVLITEQKYSQQTYDLEKKINDQRLAVLVGKEGHETDYTLNLKSNQAKLAMLQIEERVRLGTVTKDDYTAYEKAKTDQDAYDRQKELINLQSDIALAPLEHAKEVLDLQKTIATAPLTRKEEIASQAKAIQDLKTDLLFAPMKRTLDKIFNPQTEKTFSNLLKEANKARTAMTKLGDLTKLQKSVDNMKGIIDKLGTYFKTLLTKAGSKQSGGYIYSQGLYELHAGERVLTSKEVSHEVSGGGETHYHLYNPVFNDVRNVESFMKQLGQRTESLQRVPS